MGVKEGKFAISVPIGRWHPLLPAALRSLALQDPQPEIAILNAAEDRRVDKAIANSGLSISYRRDGPDAGQSAAIIEGWQNTSASFIGWLNADDLLLRNALTEAQKELSDHPGAGAVYGNSVIIDEKWNISGLHSAHVQSIDLMTRTNPISQPSCFLRRSAVEAVGGLDRSLDYVMDWDLWVRLLEGGWDMVSVDCIWSAVFWGKGTKTASMPQQRAKEVFRLLQPRFGTLDAAKGLGSMTLGGRIGRFLFRYSQSAIQAPRRRASGVLVTAARHPGEIAKEPMLVRIPNAFDTPRQTLEVISENGDLHLHSQGGVPSRTGPGCAHVTFERHVDPGHDVYLSLRARTPRPVRLSSVRWLS